MPIGERRWNPYRFVPLRAEPVERSKPLSQGDYVGLMGRISCKLTALTPMVCGQRLFIRRDGVPCIPGTSLKGVIRSVSELVGNGCNVFDKNDGPHSKCKDVNKLCITCQLFGTVHEGKSYQGNVSISDVLLKNSPIESRRWRREWVVLSSPKPRHRAFYGQSNKRKVYHHQPGRRQIGSERPLPRVSPKIQRLVEIAPAGSEFVFDVEFKGLTDTQLNLLLYALFLEPGMAHKVGGSRPLGAGSSKISVEKIMITDGKAKYTGEGVKVFEGQAALDYIAKRTEKLLTDQSETMEALRVLMHFDSSSRKEFKYPTHQWFRDRENSQKPLRTWKDFAESRD